MKRDILVDPPGPPSPKYYLVTMWRTPAPLKKFNVLFECPLILVVFIHAKIKPKDINVGEMSKNLKKMNEFMSRFLDKSQPYIFLAALPQLTSRICHSHMGKLHFHFQSRSQCYKRNLVLKNSKLVLNSLWVRYFN